jgi:hypothetical protein
MDLFLIYTCVCVCVCVCVYIVESCGFYPGFPFMRTSVSITPSVPPKVNHACWAPVAHACNLSYLGGWDREDQDVRPAQAGRQPQNNQSKMDWRCGSSAPALQAWSPEFKPQSHQKKKSSQVLVACPCNPSYMGDRDQEDRGSKPAQVNSLQDPILKIPNTKKGLVE